ncbi:hypothetical protein D5086_007541 [Populus alba]|uniref:Uncharacterized protein n=1 Tax=Populus alba TaxID=43335 RepID=A0ACC4CNV3_POPAL
MEMFFESTEQGVTAIVSSNKTKCNDPQNPLMKMDSRRRSIFEPGACIMEDELETMAGTRCSVDSKNISMIYVFLHHKHGSLEIEWYLVSDVVSVFTGLFLCYVGFLSSDIQDLLEEPLLNVDSSSINNLENKGADTVTPFGNAGLFSILTFSWMNSLIAAGNKKTLDLEDVPQLHGVDSVVGAFPVFKNKLESDCGRVTRFKVAKALFLLVWKEILWTALLALIETLGSYVGPYLIVGFVQCLDGRGEFKNQGYILASAFVVAKLAECLADRHSSFRLQQIGTRIRAVTATMIYNKSLTISRQSKQGHSSGEMINIMTIDADRLGTFSQYIHDPWVVILQVCLALLILYRNLGLGSVAGFVVIVIVMSLNYPFGRLEEKFQGKLMESKDKRMKATTEILRNMRILKLQGWEMKFLSKILELREVETRWLKKYFYTSVVFTVVAWATPTVVAVATFGTCMLMGIPLESGKVLSALATFEILQSPIYNLSDTVSMLIQTKVSLDRIASFLCLDDLQPDAIEKLPGGSSDTAIEIVDGNFSWELSSSSATLKDINFKVLNGMKVAVCGIVGSGKSNLLSSILGELPKISGTLKLCGTKAYVAQSPWIQSGTIEENILFGKEKDKERYDKVLEACSLKKDLEILSFGDQTGIGERGINLSGGQKQRIQIARALYQDAQIYLFDDPFSAVDAHTGSHLFKEVLLGLLSSKTVIYVTHQVEFLSAADLILAGKYDDILNSGSDFKVLVGAHKAALSVLDSRQAGPVSENESVRDNNGGENSTEGIVHNEGNKDSQIGKADEVAEPQAQLIQEEEREKGSVGFQIYWKYITTAYRGALMPFILLAQLLFQILQIGSTYWMAWATPVSKDVKPVVSGSRLLIVYVSLVIGSSFCILARAMLLREFLQSFHIHAEPPLVIEANRPDHSWPSHGEVDIDNLQVLDMCQLGDEVRKKERKLDSTVIENGENWSMGQRQLVCLGRVLLKKSKVLVLDEATASVDTATDNLIQQTLRQHFSDCTVITIAHRITSVLDSDMVLLLSHGLIEEYDSPTRLIENKSSSFSQLVAEYTVKVHTRFKKSTAIKFIALKWCRSRWLLHRLLYLLQPQTQEHYAQEAWNVYIVGFRITLLYSVLLTTGLPLLIEIMFVSLSSDAKYFHAWGILESLPVIQKALSSKINETIFLPPRCRKSHKGVVSEKETLLCRG